MHIYLINFKYEIWLKDNAKQIRGSTLLGDSWFTHSYVVESAVKWYGMKFIGSMSGIEIVSTYLERWDIETYFKSAKQEFNLGKCKLRAESGQRHWIVLMKIAYLIFKEHMVYLEKRKRMVTKQDVFNLIDNALSSISSTLNNVRGNYDLLEKDFEIGVTI